MNCAGRFLHSSIPAISLKQALSCPRTVSVTFSIAEKHKLSKMPPPQHSLFWKLWHQNKHYAEKALATSFIQDMVKGTLNPITYTRYNVSDAYFCYSGADDYKAAMNKTQDAILKAYLSAKYRSYRRYNEMFPRTMCLKDSSGIEPSAVCKQYSDFERSVVRDEEAIYTIFAMLPCEFLWPWLGSQIARPDASNVYRDWIMMNLKVEQGNAFAAGNFLMDFESVYGREIDHDKAGRIYRQAMVYEWQNFATACLY